MKNRYFIQLVFIAFMPFSAKSQFSPLVTISEKLKNTGSEVIVGHVMSTADGHYLKAYKSAAFSSSKLHLQKYDNEFDLEFSKEFKSGNKNEDALDFYNMKTKMALLSLVKDKKTDLLTYKFTPVNFNASIGKSLVLGKFNFEKNKDTPIYTFTQSQDSSKSMFTFYVDNNDDDLTMQVYLSVIDSSFTEVWKKKISLKRPQEVIEILSSAINNDGNAYLLIKEFEGDKAKESKKTKNSKKDERPAYKLKLIKVSGGEEDDYREFILDLKNDFVVSAAMKVLRNGEIGVLGLFSETKRKYINGVFSLKMNAADSIYNVSKKAFSTEVLDALNAEDETETHKDAEGLKDDFKFLDLTYRKDGSAMVVLEENYNYTVTNYRNRFGTFASAGYTSTTYYVTKDVITLRLNPAGEVEKIHVIPKRQEFANISLYNSSVVLTSDEGTCIVFNDDKDNLKRPMGTKKYYISSLGDCVATAVFIDKNDNITRAPLFDKEDTKAVFMPALSKKIGDKEIFFVAQRFATLFNSSDFRLGTIEF